MKYLLRSWKEISLQLFKSEWCPYSSWVQTIFLLHFPYYTFSTFSQCYICVIWHSDGKHPTSVMAWSLMFVRGSGRLYVIEGYDTLWAVCYTDLHTRLVPQIWEWFADNDVTFMHDRSACHKAKTIPKSKTKLFE